MASNRLKNLFAADPRCWHCGMETVMPEKFLPGVKHSRLDNEATVEHILERKRYDYPVTVLACNKCNDRTRLWQKALIRKQMGGAEKRS